MPKKVLLMLTVMLSFCLALPGGAAMGASAADGQSAALTNADKRLLIDYQLPFEGAVAPQAGTVALDVLIENPGEGFEWHNNAGSWKLPRPASGALWREILLKRSRWTGGFDVCSRRRSTSSY